MTTPNPDLIVLISLQPPPNPAAPQVLTLTEGGAAQLGAGSWTVFVKTGAPLDLTLPAGPVAGQRVTIKDSLGVAAAEPITVIPAAGLIDGAATKVINAAYGALRLAFDGADWALV